MEVKFLSGLSTDYASSSKAAGTFYYTTDDNQLYLGGVKISNGGDLSLAVARIATNESDITNIKATLEKIEGTDEVEGSIKKIVKDAIALIPDKVGDLETLKTTSKGTAVAAINELKESIDSLTGGSGSIADQIKAVSGDLTELTTDEKDTLVKAINEVNTNAKAAKTAAEQAKTDSVITVEKAAVDSNGIVKYTIKQGGQALETTIDIPKDLMVTSGYYDSEEKEIVLVLNNDEATEVRVDASDLVDVYTAENEGKDVVVTIDDYEISAELSSDAKTSLAKADTALQESDITTGTENGKIKVGSKEVAVHGLKSLAYMDESDLSLDDYVKEESLTDLAKMTKTALYAETDTKYDEIGAADEAETNANKYTDNKITATLTWGTIDKVEE